MSTCSFTYPRLTLVVMKLFVLPHFSLWHNPPFHSSKYADWLSEKRRKCKPYMLFWLVVSHDLSSGQTNPDLELQDCSTITLQSNTAALEALLTRTNTHRPCTRAHTCTLLYFLLSTYCSAKSSLFSYQTQAPTHTHAHLHTLSIAFLQLLLSILLSLSVS